MTLREEVAEVVTKAHRSLAVAKHLLDLGEYDFACSRAYYAVFYGIEALLMTKKLAFSKHAGVISAFNKEFVKPGVFPRSFGKKVEELFLSRQDADYEYDVAFDAAMGRESVAVAAKILAAIETYLERADLDRD